jgi:hypothetical protein
MALEFVPFPQEQIEADEFCEERVIRQDLEAANGQEIEEVDDLGFCLHDLNLCLHDVDLCSLFG